MAKENRERKYFEEKRMSTMRAKIT